jgi:hypothetical protein
LCLRCRSSWSERRTLERRRPPLRNSRTCAHLKTT